MANKKIYNQIKPLSYVIGKVGSWIFSKFFLKLKVLRNDIPKKDGRRKVVICNHESFYDFMAVITAIKGPMHMVTSSSMIRSLPICEMIKKFGVIDKNQFQTLPSDMKKMKAVLDDGKTLVLFPAGVMPEGGYSTPIPSATAKTLRWFNADVYVANIRGTYLTKPKWSKIMRKGKTSIEIYKLASAEEFTSLSVEDADKLIGANLYFDAYKNNLQDKIKFKNGSNAEGLENVVFKCPNCNKDYSIVSENQSELRCVECGYSVKMDDMGILHPNGDIPLVYSLVSDWHRFVEKSVFERVKNDENFALKTEADVYKINDKKHRFEKVGSATVILDKENFEINGKVNNEDFKKVIFAKNLPLLPSVPGKHFDIQDGADIYRIYPKEPKIVIEWILSLKAIYKLSHGLE